MPRVSATSVALAIAVAAAFALSACGSGSDAKLLPGKTAKEISQNLDSVRTLVDEQECVDAADAALEVSTEVEALRNIDAELKSVLEKGANRLNELVDQCEEPTEDTIEETEPDLEAAEVAPKKEKKPKKVEPEKTLPEEQDEEEATAGPGKSEETPPKGEAKGQEEEATPPPAEESPSGGIGPGTAAGGAG